MRFLLLCLGVMGLASTLAAEERPDLGEPPAGFEWQRCEEVNASFLKPKGWHFKHTEQKGTEAYFLTKEDIDADGKFLTGLTVNVISGAGKKNGGAAFDVVVSLVKETLKDKDSFISAQPPRDLGRVKTAGYRIKKNGTIVHAHLVADDREDKIYFIMFESPEAEWEAAWKTGETIMKKMYIEVPD